ncbi:MAG: cupin domain-containing protein [Actinomycetota bacterium]|nr:cupin domain-containing protein [Actinomycetota bacterium]
MRIPKNDIPIRIDVPGAVARQTGEFGDASKHGPLAAEYFSLGAGTDIAPLLQGLEDDACQAPHWGYIISGQLVVSYTDGTADTCSTGDVFHWPAGHSVRVIDDAEVILFSPHTEHLAVMDHMREKMGV